MQLETIWPLLLLPLPLLVYYLVPPFSANLAALRVPFVPALRAIAPEHASSHRQRGKTILLAIAWVALVIACCRPVQYGDPVELPSSARDMLLAVDISGSMDERDMKINGNTAMRIDSVKFVLSDFIERRHGDRLGLILFADNAYLQSPLTYDTDTIKTLLLDAQLGFAGQQTAIGDAIGLAIKRLIERPTESRTLILLTDGANNAGNVEPLDAAKLAAENDITIHTVGIGADRMVTRGFWGKQVVNPSRNLDEQSLRSIANQTGGQYFRAKNTRELSQIYETLDTIEPVEQEQQVYRPRKQLFYYSLSISLLTLWLMPFGAMISNVYSRLSSNKNSSLSHTTNAEFQRNPIDRP